MVRIPPEAIADTFKAICSTNAPDDGVAFTLRGLLQYPSENTAVFASRRMRSLMEHASSSRWTSALGTLSPPGPVEIDYPVLLDSSAPHIHTVETVVAEKLNAMVALGIANSRLKDFYDLWFISRTFEVDRAGILAAIQRTFERQDTPMSTDLPTGLTDQYAEQWDTRWKAYLRREHMHAAPDNPSLLIRDLREFLFPLILCGLPVVPGQLLRASVVSHK